MFVLTQAVADKTIRDAKHAAQIVSVITQMFFIGFYIYSLIVNSGYMIANAILLSLAFPYFVYYIFSIKYPVQADRKAKRIVKKIYRYTKYVIQLVTLSLSLYYIMAQFENTSNVTILLTILNAVAFLAQLITEVVRLILSYYVKLFLRAFELDFAPIVKSFHEITEFFANPGATMMAFLNKPSAALANKLMPNSANEEIAEVQKPSKLDEQLIALGNAYEQKKEREKKESKADQKEEKKWMRKQARHDQTSQFKEHWLHIGQGIVSKAKDPFKKKDKGQDEAAAVDSDKEE